LYTPQFMLQHTEVIPTAVYEAGYAFGMAVLGDRVVVAGGSGTGVESCREVQDTPQLLFFDLSTLSLIETATAPPCLTKLVADPSGDGFIANYREPAAAEWRLGHFDRHGHRSASVSQGISDDFEALAMRALSNPPRVLSLFGFGGVGTQLGLQIHDPTTLALSQSVSVSGESKSWSMGVDGLGRVVLPFRGNLNFLSLSSARFEERRMLMIVPGLALFEPVALGDAVYVGSERTVHVSRSAGSIARESFEGATPTIVALLEFPPGSGQLVAGGVSTPGHGYTAVIMRFDTRSGRFAHGIDQVGGGVLSHLEVDHAGRLWALLPWSGELLRLTPN
jgi:hypothetical protein